MQITSKSVYNSVISVPLNNSGTGSDPTAAAARPHQSTSGETLTAGSRVKGEEVGKEGPMFERRRGETVRAYFDRIDVEANARIMESYRTSRKKSDRKKRYSSMCM